LRRARSSAALAAACFTALCAAAGGWACAPRPEVPEGSITDDAGRAVALEAPASRIVSLSPATTELLFALGAGEQVVGRTRWCADPAEVSAVPSVGDGLDPNVELIVSLRPDLVVFYHSAMNDAATARLGELGIATASVKLDRLADLTRAAELLGALTGRGSTADSLARTLEPALDRAAAVDSGPSVLILAWDNPPIVIGGASFLSEIVALAGGRNVFGDLAQPSATVSIEAVAARDPDVVLATGGEAEPAWSRRPEWRVVGAVARGSFATVQGSEFSYPSFRAPEAVAQLRAALGELPR